MNTDYDVVIVGAGPAGSTAAILLAAANWSVALIEKQPFPRRKVCGACISASNLPLLATLGIGDEFAQRAGPELHEVALYCGDRVVQAPLPAMPNARHPWGRALGRETFDLLLLERARELGVSVWQPWTVRAIHGSGGDYRCAIEARPALPRAELRAPVVIMANGSWEADPGATRRIARSRGDLFAFHANFSGAQLAPGVLPVISFAGGYGGLVVAENGQLTLAGCIRRDVLKACRVTAHGQTAGDAFEGYLRAHTGVLRKVLEGAKREGSWLGIGPIQPGIRAPWHGADGRFMIGNAAAEAHPIIGEGISMAMQSARLLCACLIAAGRRNASADTLQRVGTDYARDWRQAFAPRLHLAATLAHLAMRPWLAPIVWPFIVRTPQLMTALARAAGKARTAPALQGLPPLGQFDSLGDLN
ncbi:MAG TPA: FAD-dependent oxidoreductase [Steroidobacteraceae bacterium]|nr:FAD-dependent oxidoreductase [Steroidobacteraceae bacterium]